MTTVMVRACVLASLVLLVSLPGCDDDGGVTDEDAACFEWSGDGEEEMLYVVNNCEADFPCDELRLRCPGSDEAVDCALRDATVENPDALLCILDSFAAGQDGAYVWSATADEDPGWANRIHRIWLSGGRAFYATSHDVDLSYDGEGLQEVELRPASDFAACRTQDSDAARLECLMDPWTEVVQEVLPPN